MLEFFRSIPGPIFLLIYIILGIAMIIIAKIWTKYDGTQHYTIPEPTIVTPLEMAFLKQGMLGVITNALLSLWEKKKISIIKEKNNVLIKHTSSNPNDLNTIEKSILDYAKTNDKYIRFTGSYFQGKVKEKFQKNIDKLEQMGLSPTKETKSHYWKVYGISNLILLFLGGIKLYLGITYDKPVGFLIILMIAFQIAMFISLLPTRILATNLGKKFLAQSKTRFEWLKSSDNNTLATDDNLMYGTALFGIAAFSAIAFTGMDENPALLEQNLNSNNTGSSCSGSSCSGSSCSGSSCGGSGCGGCGGGD